MRQKDVKAALETMTIEGLYGQKRPENEEADTAS
jgi:hypothetical protein